MNDYIPALTSQDIYGTSSFIGGPCTFFTTDSYAEVEVSDSGDRATKCITIDCQRVARSDLKEIISFLKAVRRGLAK